MGDKFSALGARTTKELVKKALREEQGSAFTQRIADALPPKKSSLPKFNVSNSLSKPAGHVRYYKQIMAYWISNDTVRCKMFLVILGDYALRWFLRLPAGQIDHFRKLIKQFTAQFITNI